MNQEESGDSNLIPLLLELAVDYLRANPSQASQDEFRHKLIDAGMAPDLVSRILTEPTNLLKQPDPQPSIEVSEQSPSLLLYFALCAFAVFLAILGFNIQAANWASFILNLSTEIIGAVLILIIVDRRLRRDELQAIQKYAESSSTRLSSIFIPDVRDSVSYAKALSFELRRIQPKAYFVRKEYDDLLERYSGDILLYGVGGCGKSTFLQSIALKQAERVKRQPRSKIPIILPMRQWSSGEINNQLWKAFHGFSKANPQKFHKWLYQGRFIIMLDGLDESQEPKLMLMEIKEFKNRYPNIPVLASCRSIFLADAEPMLGFQSIELSSLSNAEAAEFIRTLKAQERK
mgnify:CR=1 FL=1